MAHILVVEDNDPVRWSLANLLRLWGHDVKEAANGRQALDYCTKDAYDLVLMDIYMPTMNGLEACHRLRQRSKVPILMLSTNQDPYLQREALNCGANAFLPKPFDFDGLRDWVRTLLSARSGNGALTNGFQPA